jgi:hypothetical protein
MQYTPSLSTGARGCSGPFVAFSGLSNHERVNAANKIQQYQCVSKTPQNATKHSRFG